MEVHLCLYPGGKREVRSWVGSGSDTALAGVSEPHSSCRPDSFSWVSLGFSKPPLQNGDVNGSPLAGGGD